VDWLRRSRHTPPGDSGPGERRQAGPTPTVRAAPGIVALFDGLSGDGRHAVLDLGPAAEIHLRLFSVFSRQVRFADLLTQPLHGPALAGALRALPPGPQQPYDVVLAWDLLDRLIPEERPRVIERLHQLTAPGARLHIIVNASGEPTVRRLRYTLVDLERISQNAVGPPVPAQRQLLPAEVERLLAPFEVVRAFTLRMGLREYLAVKKAEWSYEFSGP
jgi:hypothetical protein